MRNFVNFAVVTIVVLGIAAPMARAQRGMGDATGLARQPITPAVVSFSGKVVEIWTGPCEATTGRSSIGTHLILKTTDEEQLNVHLGPANAVADTVAKLSVGQEITVKAFRTEKMKEHHYTAQSLTFGQTTAELRDADLRPVWAQGTGAPRGTMAGGARPGKGRGAGWGRGGRGWRGGR